MLEHGDLIELPNGRTLLFGDLGAIKKDYIGYLMVLGIQSLKVH